MKKTTIISSVIGGLIFVGGIGYLAWLDARPGKYDDFAQCIASKGAKFYGAFWCPHCQNQKKMFGNSAKYLPYIECSAADGRTQLPICNDAKIDGYPTWVYADGSHESGELSLERLAVKTGCTLTQ